MNIQKNKKINPLIAICALLVLTTVYLTIAYLRHYPPFASQKQAYEVGEQFTSMERSETEKKDSEKLKENPEQKLQNNQTDAPVPSQGVTTDGRKTVNVLLTSAGIYSATVSASGMVTDASEDDGRCTFTFINEDEVIVKVSDTLINPTSTACRTVSFPSSELEMSGLWKVKLSYDSAVSSGVSVEKEITK